MVRCVRTISLFALVLTAACGDAEQGAGPKPSTEEKDAAPPSSASSIAFETEPVATMLPGETREMPVIVAPPGAHQVRFALLGGSLDASLDRDEVVTDGDGRASVKLTAPNTATTFRLRAIADEGPATEAAVSVSGDGFASAMVLPSYEGIRNTPMWSASAYARSKCSDLPAIPLEEGPIRGMATDGTPVRLEGLPVGPTIAITLRSAHAVAGCYDLRDLETGVDRDILVKVRDTPLKVEATNLALDLVMTPNGNAARALVDGARGSFLDDLFPDTQSEARTLLDAMAEQVADQDGFDEARALGGWDALAAARFDESGELMRTRVGEWIDEGLSALSAGSTATGRLTAMPSGNAHATYALETLFGLDAEEGGVPTENVLSMSVNPGDLVIVGGTLPWLPTRVLAAAADTAVREANGGDGSAAEELTAWVDCAGLVEQLQEAGPLPSTCQAPCIQAACEQAISRLWSQAASKSAASYDVGGLAFTISGTALVNGEAVIVGWTGTWLGTATWGGAEVSLKGTTIAGEQVPQTP